ncbi:MAG: GGDEF domain-containing protein [Treponema sp.]|nr:GGDEF domain-containing protein [Treponema sp.]
MNKMFSNNLLNLHRTNKIVAVFAAAFAFFPIVFEKDIFKAGVYLVVALVAFLISIYSNYLMQQININNRIIYTLIVLYHTNLIIFGVYLDIWSVPGTLAAIFPCFIICALLMFINPPRFNFLLISGAMIVYIVSAVVFIKSSSSIYYILNGLIAGLLSLYFSWQITKLRLGLEISTNMLEDEKNKYLDQSTVDELTQLKNRRDFMQTFQRYLSNYRTSDDWLCIALADIDFFKLYNDNYGHPQGDVCLRSIGDALNWLRDDLGVYSARVGGEEFAVLWFEKSSSHVDKVITKWMETIRNLKIPHEKSKVSDFVTMSIGVYRSRCGSSHDTQYLYDLADKALYSAKGGGRNCAVITGDDIKQYKITPKDTAE